MQGMTKRQAWDYAFGMIRVDGLIPSNELRQMAEGDYTSFRIRSWQDYGRFTLFEKETHAQL